MQIVYAKTVWRLYLWESSSQSWNWSGKLWREPHALTVQCSPIRSRVTTETHIWVHEDISPLWGLCPLLYEEDWPTHELWKCSWLRHPAWQKWTWARRQFLLRCSLQELYTDISENLACVCLKSGSMKWGNKLIRNLTAGMWQLFFCHLLWVNRILVSLICTSEK